MYDTDISLIGLTNDGADTGGGEKYSDGDMSAEYLLYYIYIDDNDDVNENVYLSSSENSSVSVTMGTESNGEVLTVVFMTFQ